MTDTSNKGRDQRGLQFLPINDFSPGCFDASLTVGSVPSTPGFAPGPFPAPLGAADANQTYGCMNLPTGGLGPLPKMVQSHSLSDFSITPTTLVLLMAFFPTGMNDVGEGDDIVIVYAHDSGSDIHIVFDKFKWTAPGSHVNFANHTVTASSVANVVPFSVYPFMTRVAASSPTTTVGNPTLVIPVQDNTGGVGEGIVLYPDPSAPTVEGVATIDPTPDFVGAAFGHQGRIVMILATATSAIWPANPAGTNAFELVSYTEPPNSETWGAQDEVFGPENPYGYGAVTSVSAGELFLVKTRGGAIIIQGDLNNPTVTTLTGVKSTGPFYGQPASDANGSYYCVINEGAWVWNGGNTSQKISAQLDDNFFTPHPSMPVPTTAGYIDFQPYGYFCQRWGQWMMFSNNWMYNSASGGWWRLFNPTTASFFYYGLGAAPSTMYASVITTTGNTAQIFYEFDATQPTNSYQWQSLPIRPAAMDRTIDVREVTVRASNPTEDANAQIAVHLVDSAGAVHAASSTWTLSAATRGVQIHRFNFGVKTEDVVVRLTCTGTTASPIVYDLNIGYRIREGAVTV